MAQEFSESELPNPNEDVDARINGFCEEASELSEEITENDIEDLQELQEMVEMVNWKKKQTIKSLRKAADKLDQVCRDCKVAHAIGTTGGVVSGVISICATVGTGGAVAPLLLATGMGLGLGGAAINLGTSYIEAASNSAEVKNAEKLLKETSDCVKKVNALVRHWLETKEIARLAYICCLATQLKLDPFVINFLYEVSSLCLRPFSKVTEKSAGTVVPAKNAFSLTGSKAPAKSIKPFHRCRQVVDDGAAGAAGQAGGKVGENVAKGSLILVNVAFLMFDALDLGFTIRDICENKGSEAAKYLREKANELEATMKQ